MEQGRESPGRVLLDQRGASGGGTASRCRARDTATWAHRRSLWRQEGGDGDFADTPPVHFSFSILFPLKEQQHFLFNWGLRTFPKIMRKSREAHNNIRMLAIFLF